MAAPSGIAKTTIYRRYSIREALLRAALTAVIGSPGEPPDTDPRQRIRWALEQTWHQMAEVLALVGSRRSSGTPTRGFTDLFRSVRAPYTDWCPCGAESVRSALPALGSQDSHFCASFAAPERAHWCKKATSSEAAVTICVGVSRSDWNSRFRRSEHMSAKTCKSQQRAANGRLALLANPGLATEGCWFESNRGSHGTPRLTC